MQTELRRSGRSFGVVIDGNGTQFSISELSFHDEPATTLAIFSGFSYANRKL